MSEETVAPAKIQRLISTRLASLRSARNMSRPKAEKASGVAWDAIRRIEEINQTVSVEVLFKLCRAYKVSPIDIISPTFTIEI